MTQGIYSGHFRPLTEWQDFAFCSEGLTQETKRWCEVAAQEEEQSLRGEDYSNIKIYAYPLAARVTNIALLPAALIDAICHVVVGVITLVIVPFENVVRLAVGVWSEPHTFTIAGACVNFQSALKYGLGISIFGTIAGIFDPVIVAGMAKAGQGRDMHELIEKNQRDIQVVIEKNQLGMNVLNEKYQKQKSNGVIVVAKDREIRKRDRIINGNSQLLEKVKNDHDELVLKLLVKHDELNKSSGRKDWISKHKDLQNKYDKQEIEYLQLQKEYQQLQEIYNLLNDNYSDGDDSSEVEGNNNVENDQQETKSSEVSKIEEEILKSS